MSRISLLVRLSRSAVKHFKGRGPEATVSHFNTRHNALSTRDVVQKGPCSQVSCPREGCGSPNRLPSALPLAPGRKSLSLYGRVYFDMLRILCNARRCFYLFYSWSTNHPERHVFVNHASCTPLVDRWSGIRSTATSWQTCDDSKMQACP